MESLPQKSYLWDILGIFYWLIFPIYLYIEFYSKVTRMVTSRGNYDKGEKTGGKTPEILNAPVCWHISC